MTTLKTKLVLFLLLVPWAFAGCGKDASEEPQPTGAPQIQKSSIQVSQLLGLKINSRPVEEVAGKSPDPMVLDAQDLQESFGIKDAAYLEQTLQLIQSQLQSGNPLKFISIFTGTLPKKYAAKCAVDVDQDTCLIEPVAFNCSEALAPKSWSAPNYFKMCDRLGRIKAYNPNYLVAVFDGDNTLWYQDVSNAGVKQGVESKKIIWEEARAELLGVYPIPAERAAYKTQKTPYDYYKELYKTVGPLWNYNYAALAFRGLSLQEAYQIWQEMMKQPYAPVPFPEMSDLLRYLHQQGVVTGVASASPVFGVIPTTETLNTGLPLDRIEGLDVFIKDAQVQNALPIRLSRLLNQGRINPGTGQIEKFKNYQEFLALYGSWIIVDVDHIINARGGKGVQSRSLIRRHVADWNRDPMHEKNLLDIDDMRLVMIGGDNFAHATDIQEPAGDRVKSALEGGNDQGMSEGASFLENRSGVPGGTDILFIRRYEMDVGGQVSPKKGALENFELYVKQQKLLRPDRVGEVVVQEAITDIEAVQGKGGFLKDTPAPPPTPQATAMPASPPPQAPATPGPGAKPSTPQPLINPAAPPLPVPPASPTVQVPQLPTPAAPPPSQLEPLPPAEPKLDALP